MIAGVASGLSDFFGIDAALIRILFVLSSLFAAGAGAMIYLVLWLTLPTNTAGPFVRRRRGLAWIIVVCVLAAGTISVLNDNRVILIGLVVLVVALLVWRRLRRRRPWRAQKEFEKARLAWQRRLDEHAAQASRPTALGGDPFHIDSFFSTPPPGTDIRDGDEPPSGFQTQ